MKTCSKCLMEKPLIDFHYRKDSEKYRSSCKLCWGSTKEARRQQNLERDLSSKRKYYELNKKAHKSTMAAWRLKPGNRELENKLKTAWKKRNRGKVNADWMARHAAKKCATPKWLSDEQKLQMEVVYTFAAFIKHFYGISYDVDHIEPLRGKEVCGLHVPWNLQLLTPSENYRKNNKRL